MDFLGFAFNLADCRAATFPLERAAIGAFVAAPAPVFFPTSSGSAAVRTLAAPRVMHTVEQGVCPGDSLILLLGGDERLLVSDLPSSVPGASPARATFLFSEVGPVSDVPGVRRGSNRLLIV